MRQTNLHINELKATLGNKNSFQVNDLFAFYESFEPEVAKSTINWRIHTLIKAEIIKRIGRGKFQYGKEKTFQPFISQKALRINYFMKTNFPYLNYIIWHISELNTLSQHLVNKDIYYVEVERIAIDSVCEQLRDKFKYVHKGKTNPELNNEGSIIVVRPLVTAAPIQIHNKVATTSIEKLLVDIFADKEFEYLQGYEMTHIFKNAFSNYTVNINKLLRYASRKAKKEEISAFIKSDIIIP